MDLNTTIKRPVLRYHGGKFILAKWIVSHFPAHRVYVEPFGGAASVLMRKEPSYAEVYNDVWGTVVNVFAVLRDPALAEDLEKRLYLTPFSREEFERCSFVELSEIADPVERARLTIFRSFAGFGSASANGNHATGFRANSNRRGTTPAKDWKNYPDNIKTFTERLRGVVIECRHYSKIIEQHDTPNTLYYVDPPYVHITRNMARGNAAYAHEMTDADHVELSEQLKKVKGKVVVSGYHSQLYDALYKGWKTVERDALADGASKRTEVLWLSPNIRNQT